MFSLALAVIVTVAALFAVLHIDDDKEAFAAAVILKKTAIAAAAVCAVWLLCERELKPHNPSTTEIAVSLPLNPVSALIEPESHSVKQLSEEYDKGNFVKVLYLLKNQTPLTDGDSAALAGNCYFQLQNTAEAEKLYNEALEKYSRNDENKLKSGAVMYNLSLIYLQDNQNIKADKYCRESIRVFRQMRHTGWEKLSEKTLRLIASR